MRNLKISASYNFSPMIRAIRHTHKLAKVADAATGSKTSNFLESVSKPFTVTTYAKPNLVITKGEGSYLYDMENRKYVDFTAGIAVTALGHSNPQITKILEQQAGNLIHCSNLYYNKPAGDLAEKLVHATTKSGGMSDAARVFLSNSGTEANEAALKFARKYGKAVGGPDKYEIISFQNCFHGRTMGTLSVTNNPKYQEPFAPMVPGARAAVANDINSVEAVISTEKTCAVIIEPVQGEGGVIPVEESFLIELKALCEKHNALLIYDEIQCGLGRTGKFWAHSFLPSEAHPDIVTSAKALGNGFPIAATIINERVELVLAPGDHGTTYGGNPLGSSVASYVVDTIGDATFLEQVSTTSETLKKQLEKLADEFADIECVRGKGLLVGLKFSEKVPVGKVVDKCREYGLLVITAGDNVVRIVPALNISEETVLEGTSILAQAIKDVVEGKE